MKKLALILIIGILIVSASCTVEEPGFVSITNDPNVIVVDSDSDIITIDELSRAITTVDFAHHELHEGRHFHHSEVTDLGNGATRDVLLVTPDTNRWVHLLINVMSESEMSFTFYEDTVTSNNGTAVFTHNSNRNSTNTAGLSVSHSPTISDVGNIMQVKHWGSGRGVGGDGRGENEWILKQNAKYLIRVTNATSNNNQTEIELFWYEHISLK